MASLASRIGIDRVCWTISPSGPLRIIATVGKNLIQPVGSTAARSKSRKPSSAVPLATRS